MRLHFQPVRLERRAIRKQKLDRRIRHRRKSIFRILRHQHRKFAALDKLLNHRAAVLAFYRAGLGTNRVRRAAQRIVIDPQTVSRVRRFHKHRKPEARNRVLGLAGELRKSHAARVRDVFHEFLRRVVKPRARSRIRQFQALQRPDHVDRRHVPIEIPFAEVDENVIPVLRRDPKLAIRRRFMQEQMIDPAARQQRRQIPRRIVVAVVDRRVAIIRLQHANLHSASRKIILSKSASVIPASFKMQPVEVWSSSDKPQFAFTSSTNSSPVARSLRRSTRA